jgi:cell division protein FtsL
MWRKQMKLHYWLILVLILPSVIAYQTNTTITVDWIGNDMFYLRTEAGDFLLNSTNQADTTYFLNLTRQLETNLTEGQQILSYLTNFTSSYANMSIQYYTSLNFTNSEYNELLANWTRCNLDKNTLMDEVKVFDSARVNMTKETRDCLAYRDAIQTTLNNCNNDYARLATNITGLNKKASDNTMLGLIIGGLIIGAVWYFSSQSKKNKAHPVEMGLYGS